MSAKTVRHRLPRSYDAVLRDHRARHRQMAFVTGPRQVGKTTTCRAFGDVYLNWDDLDHRRVLLAGPAAIAAHVGASELRANPVTCVFDELHRHRHWRTLLKGLFDTYGDRLRCLVTGSSRLDVFRKGGESLMGRYLHYRMHPLSVGELLRQDVPASPIREPRKLAEAKFSALWEHGGYPEPYLKRDRRFSSRWRALRTEQMLRGDVRDLTRIQELDQVEHLGRLLAERSGEALVYSHVAEDVQVSVDTARRWVAALGALHWGFLVRPWWRNVSRALRKEPKWYLRDWGGCADAGARAETFVACHLLKAVETWEDLGLGHFELRYLRDKLKREVDFVVVRDRKPWFLVEVKSSERSLSPALGHFQKETGAPHAFQVVVDMPYVDADCFAQGSAPLVVPARTFLSQLA